MRCRAPGRRRRRRCRRAPDRPLAAQEDDGRPRRKTRSPTTSPGQIKTLRGISASRSGRSNSTASVRRSEVVELRCKAAARPAGGSMPESAPSYHRSDELPLEQRLVSILDAHGLRARRTGRSPSPSRRQPGGVRTDPPVRLVQLIDAEAIASTAPIPIAPSTSCRRRSAHLCDLLTMRASEISPRGRYQPWNVISSSVKGVDQDNDGPPDDVNGDGAVNDADATRSAHGPLRPAPMPPSLRPPLYLPQRGAVPGERLWRQSGRGVPPVLLPRGRWAALPISRTRR